MRIRIIELYFVENVSNQNEIFDREREGIKLNNIAHLSCLAATSAVSRGTGRPREGEND